MGVWQGQFTKLRAPKLYNLRTDPFERGPESLNYGNWQAHRCSPLRAGAGHHCAKHRKLQRISPRAKAASFSVSDAMDKITADSPNQN